MMLKNLFEQPVYIVVLMQLSLPQMILNIGPIKNVFHPIVVPLERNGENP